MEHAPPQAIVAALQGARAPQPSRTEFTRRDLNRLGLVSEMDTVNQTVSPKDFEDPTPPSHMRALLPSCTHAPILGMPLS